MMFFSNKATPVEVRDMAHAKDKRRMVQEELLEKYGFPLITFSMNIAGEYKRSPLIDFAFSQGDQWIMDSGLPVVERKICDEHTGLEGYYVVDADPDEVKRVTSSIEEGNPVGRLFDMDVSDEKGQKLSRLSGRTCIVCGGPVFVCSRSRAHGLPVIKEKTREILKEFAVQRAAELAVKALKDEAGLTPKPGLVDQKNNGAHKDMDYAMFLRSADSLHSYFEEMVQLGMESGDVAKARSLGLDAEQAMYHATGGVNTHMGAIYGFGLILMGLGRCLMVGGDILETAQKMAEKLERPKMSISETGARKEALMGFPTVRGAYEILEEGGNPYLVLLDIVSKGLDTNLLRRGGQDAVDFVIRRAEEILISENDLIQELKIFDEELIARNLSPGGSADILAMAFFLNKV